MDEQLLQAMRKAEEAVRNDPHLAALRRRAEEREAAGMSTNGPTPPPCDQNIFRDGQPVAFISGSSNAVETWVQSVAWRANVPVDWHYSGGVAQVLFLGDTDAWQRVLLAIEELKPDLVGTLLQVLSDGEPGLPRRGA